MDIIIILLCLWTIALELKLRRRDKDVKAVVTAVRAVADGNAKIVRKDGTAHIIYNQQRSQ